jgi:ABC-type Na+ transport system ATPase subunit NatA
MKKGEYVLWKRLESEEEPVSKKATRGLFHKVMPLTRMLMSSQQTIVEEDGTGVSDQHREPAVEADHLSISDNVAVEVRELTKRYGELTAVNGVSFVVRRGEIFAFLGPNGAGKTTTVEILECLRKPTSGKAYVLGFDTSKNQSEIKKKTGILPQNFNTYERLTVKETIQYYASMFGASPDTDELMKLVDLEGKKNVLFRNLSGGLKQRLGIAVALVNDPEVVFLDEPSAGLDPKARHGVWQLIDGLQRARSNTTSNSQHGFSHRLRHSIHSCRFIDH